MVMVYISRHGAKFGDGDKIKWEVGEPAVFYSSFGECYNVTIVKNFVINNATPDKRCLEVILDDTGETYSVLAERVEPRGGFPPGPHENPSERSVIETLAQASDAIKQILRQEFPEADPARFNRAIKRIADVADAYAEAEWRRGLAERERHRLAHTVDGPG